MPQRPQKKDSAPAEIIDNLSLGYNGYTDPSLTKPQMWAQAVNVFSGAFGFVQRCRFANVAALTPATGLPFKSLKYFALPGLSSYLLADINGKLYSYDTGSNYARTQRINPFIDPAGSGSASLNGPWSREVLQNIVYEMNGTVKQAGRNANAATIEGFGLDAPDASPQVTINAGQSQNITGITRSNGVVTATLSAALTISGNLVNAAGVTDTSFNGTFSLLSGNGTTTLTWSQFGQNTSSSGGTANTNITKATGRSFAWAWENANKVHISAPSPSTQFIALINQNAVINCIEPGTLFIAPGSASVVGTGTFFTSAWVGRSLWTGLAGTVGRILSVQSPTAMTLAVAFGPGVSVGSLFQVYDPQATHVRLYETADGGATYFRTQRNAFVPSGAGSGSGLTFFDNGNSEPPNFPFTTETSQLFNQPPPIGAFLNEYQGRLCVFGVPGALQSFFYSNIESTNIGMPQESYAPLNQVTLPIANGQLNGMLEFPGSLVIWSDKQDMFRLTGLLTDNTALTASQQGASISRLPYSLGACSPFAMDITPLGGIWVTPTAEVWLYTDRYAPRNIGRPVQDILNSISKSQLANVRAKYFHANNRNWFVLAVPASGSTFNNTLLALDLDLLASNGSPSYFTFDMATNHPAWFVFQPGPLLTSGTPPVTVIVPRCDSLETVFENNGNVRLLSSAADLIQDVDYQTGNSGTEIQVPGAGFTPHAWGNEHAFVIKRPSFIRFNTNQDPSLLAAQGWSFQAQGIDDDFYTFGDPLRLNLTPGVNDTSSLCGNPSLSGGSSFRHSPELFKIGGVNFVAGRRLKFQVNFPALPGDSYQLRSIQIGFGPSPPR